MKCSDFPALLARSQADGSAGWADGRFRADGFMAVSVWSGWRMQQVDATLGSTAGCPDSPTPAKLQLTNRRSAFVRRHALGIRHYFSSKRRRDLHARGPSSRQSIVLSLSGLAVFKRASTTLRKSLFIKRSIMVGIGNLQLRLHHSPAQFLWVQSAVVVAIELIE